MITRIVKLTFKTEYIEAFTLLFEQTKERIASFDGCNQLIMMQHHHLPHVFFTYSIWNDENALENYRNSDLFAETWKKTKAMFSEKAEAWTTIERFNSINSLL